MQRLTQAWCATQIGQLALIAGFSHIRRDGKNVGIIHARLGKSENSGRLKVGPMSLFVPGWTDFQISPTEARLLQLLLYDQDLKIFNEA